MLFLTSDIRALWRSALSARVPECPKLKNCRLGLYGTEHLNCNRMMTLGFKGLTLIRLNDTQLSFITPYSVTSAYCPGVTSCISHRIAQVSCSILFHHNLHPIVQMKMFSKLNENGIPI